MAKVALKTFFTSEPTPREYFLWSSFERHSRVAAITRTQSQENQDQQFGRTLGGQSPTKEHSIR